MLGISGALIAGGLRKVLSGMVSKGIVDVIVSTGAILYQTITLLWGTGTTRDSEFRR
jgi:deoxyhypusine synthase